MILSISEFQDRNHTDRAITDPGTNIGFSGTGSELITQQGNRIEINCTFSVTGPRWHVHEQLHTNTYTTFAYSVDNLTIALICNCRSMVCCLGWGINETRVLLSEQNPCYHSGTVDLIQDQIRVFISEPEPDPEPNLHSYSGAGTVHEKLTLSATTAIWSDSIVCLPDKATLYLQNTFCSSFVD